MEEPQSLAVPSSLTVQAPRGEVLIKVDSYVHLGLLGVSLTAKKNFLACQSHSQRDRRLQGPCRAWRPAPGIVVSLGVARPQVEAPLQGQNGKQQAHSWVSPQDTLEPLPLLPCSGWESLDTAK